MVSVKKIANTVKPNKSADKVQKKKFKKEKGAAKPEATNKKKFQAKEVANALAEKSDNVIVKTAPLKLKKKKEKKPRAKVTMDGSDPSLTTEAPETLATQEALAKAAKNVIEGFSKEQKTKNSLFDEDTRLLIQVQAVKLPTLPKRFVTLKLPHSLVDVTQCDVCFIITDLDKTKKKDHDAAIENFKEKLDKAGINFVKTIIPFTKLKKDYSTFELQKKFANSYDLFLLDGRISGHITGGVLRKAFHRRNKLITVTLSDAKLKQSIEAALFKTRYHQPLIPQLISIEVGTIKMSSENVAENITTVLEQLKEEYPGGWMNIKSIHLKAAAQSAIVHPLYISTINPNLIKVPEVENTKFDKMKKIADKLDKPENRFKLSGDKLIKKVDKKRKAPAAEDEDEDSPKKAKTENETKKSKKDKKKAKKESNDDAENVVKMETARTVKPEVSDDDSDDDMSAALNLEQNDSDDDEEEVEQPKAKPQQKKKGKADNKKKNFKKGGKK